ncbi:MAG: putative polysaccharide biosynthesis protein [Bacillota bacterium]
MTSRLPAKQTIVQGAIVLTIAGILIRIMGMVYRIPVGRWLGDEGLGIYAVPNQFYLLFFTISSAGIPVAVARVISEKISAGHYRDAHRVFRIAFAFMFTLGLFFSMLLFFGASWLVESGLVANPDSYMGLLAVSPVIFFAALTSSFRGLFQGLQNMSPVAVSQVADQSMLVTGTILFTYLMLPKGLSLAAAGANLGAVPGAMAATLIMAVYYFRHRGNFMEMVNRDTSGFRENKYVLLKKILAVSIPISFASVALIITGIIDNKLIIDRLQLVGYTQQQATAYYGQFNQMAMSFVNISIAFAMSLGTSLVPSVAEAREAKNNNLIRQQASTAIRLSLLTTLPAAAGLFALAPNLTYFIYANSEAGIPLAVLSPAIVFWGLHLVLSGILQGLARADITALNLLVGIAAKISITYYLIPTPMGIRAAALGTVVMFIISSTLNFFSVRRMVGIDFNILSSFFRPALSALIMGLAVQQIHSWSMTLFHHSYIATIIALISGMIIFPILAMVSGSVSPEDLRSVPGIGGRAANLLSGYNSLVKRIFKK